MPDPYERRSDTIRRQKSVETMVAEAIANFEYGLTGNTKLSVTASATGNPRVRAYIFDEDGNIGWVARSSFAGVARVTDGNTIKYVVEQHVPHAGSQTHVWELDPASQELTFRLLSAGERLADQPGTSRPADEEHMDPLLKLSADIATDPYIRDYELGLYGQYTFQHPELQ